MELHIEYLGVDALRPYDRNTRAHEDFDVSQIALSIQKYGFSDPIGIWGPDNVIVEGHGRLMAAKRLGMDTVPVIRLDHLTDTERREYAILHNKTAELSNWNPEMLQLEMQDLDLTDFDIDFGIEEESDAGTALADEDDFDEEPPEEPKTKPGDVYRLGRHRLMCGSATSVDDVEKLMDGDTADLLLTDPPYNVDYTGKTKDALKIQNDVMDGDDFLQFLRDAFTSADAVMKPGAVYYIWHADSEGYNFRHACADAGWELRECLIWNKNSLVLGRQDYQWKHEPCLYGWKEGAAHYWGGDRKQTTVIDFDRPTRSEEHPTMKPVGLFDYQIKNSSRKGEIVLDLFGGSGTTMIACEKNGRACRMMELDPKYCDVIVARWEKLTGEKAELINE